MAKAYTVLNWPGFVWQATNCNSLPWSLRSPLQHAIGIVESDFEKREKQPARILVRHAITFLCFFLIYFNFDVCSHFEYTQTRDFLF